MLKTSKICNDIFVGSNEFIWAELCHTTIEPMLDSNSVVVLKC